MALLGNSPGNTTTMSSSPFTTMAK
jgi:hypothetical protein